MQLPRPFYRLPLRFDVTRLQHEVAQIPLDAWVSHPNGIAGNSAVRLISVGGDENDDVDGTMLPTMHLRRSPYLRQVLASFGVVWSRSRLMKLAPRSDVPEHADINYHWHHRVRLHIPVFTQAGVEFTCGEETVHMAAGEAWIFDNWRRHRVVNRSPAERIHLVADTTGSSQFWRLVGQGQTAGAARRVRYDRAQDGAMPLMERTRLAPVMPPAEVDMLLLDLKPELPAGGASLDYQILLEAFRRDWRQLYALYGESEDGWPHYSQLRTQLREQSIALAAGLTMRTNAIPAHRVLEGRLLRAILPAVPADLKPRRPVFIIAAPRSGSTLLFETLAASESFQTLGGEAPWLIEDNIALRPGAPGVESNRLEAQHASAEVETAILGSIKSHLRDREGKRAVLGAQTRLLEKTPKNALRIPFLSKIFPDALFVFLWRDPRENLSSIIEAWRSGGWKTYNGLDGFDGPWSLLLPPGWRALNGAPLEEIAAFQWSATNTIALNDLEALPAGRWMALSYAELLSDPRAAVTRICHFAGAPVDASLERRVSHALPLSRFTQTPPDSNKWQRNREIIERVLPRIEAVWQRLLSLQSPKR